MADNDPIGVLLRAETRRRHHWPDVRIHEVGNSVVTVAVGDDDVELSGHQAQALWEWLKAQPDDLSAGDFLARARILSE